MQKQPAVTPQAALPSVVPCLLPTHPLIPSSPSRSEWMDPSEEYSPEVFSIRKEMHDLGCDMYLDVHGDEELPYNFGERESPPRT